MNEKIAELKKNLKAIKSTLVSGAPRVNKERRIMNLVNMSLEVIAEIEKDNL